VELELLTLPENLSSPFHPPVLKIMQIKIPQNVVNDFGA
jgi:hypothetical protein